MAEFAYGQDAQHEAEQAPNSLSDGMDSQTGFAPDAQPGDPLSDQPATQDARSGNSSGAQSSNRWETKQLVVMALFCALAILLSFIEFPIFPAAPFLKYDASFVPVMVGGFAYGAGPGIAIGVVAAAVHGLLLGDIPGTVMNILVTIGYVLPASLIYRKYHKRKGAVIGLVAGSLCAIVVAILANLLITPLYLGVPLESVLAMVVPVLLPFNALKMAINSILTFVVYKSISNLITPKKNRVSEK